MELGHLLLEFLVCVIVWSCDDERDRLGREIAAADEPLISLKEGVVSRVSGGGSVVPLESGQGVLRSLSALWAQVVGL